MGPPVVQSITCRRTGAADVALLTWTGWPRKEAAGAKTDR